MKNLAVTFLILCASVFGVSQATTGFHRVSQAIQRGPDGVEAQVVPYATVYVTNTGTGGVATIYSDPLLSSLITSGLVTADQSGNYSYYIPLNYCVTETVSSPGAGSYVTPNICQNSGSALPAGPQFAVQFNGGTAAFAGNANFTTDGLGDIDLIDATSGTGFGLGFFSVPTQSWSANIASPCTAFESIVPGSTCDSAYGSSDYTFPAFLTSKYLGPLYECDQYPGANASVKVTNCNAAAVAAGGGVIDLRNLGGQPISSPEVETQMMVWGDATGHYSVTVLLPPAATWSWALNSSTTCGIQVNDMVDVAGEASLAGANRMVIEAGSGTFTMDSLMCTNTAVGFEYVKARGFHLSNGNSAATFLNGLLHVVGMWDSSSIEYFSIFNSYGDMVHIDGACCGASMRHFGVYGSGPSTNTGGMNIKLGTGYVMFNSTITNGSTNVCMASGGTLNSTYVGKQVNGPGIALQTVAAVTSPSCITLTTPATASSTGSEVLIYGGTNQTAFNLTLEDFAANWPGINEPIIMIPPVLSGSSPHNITIANGYSEGNGEFDTTTPDIYIPYPADAIFIKGFQQDHGFNSTKYTVENHTPGEVEISGLYSGNSNLNDVVTGVQIPTSNSVTFPFYSESGFADPELANATCFSGNTYGKLLKITCPLTSVVNLVTDSAFSQGPTNWTTINGTTTFNPGLGYQGDGAIVFTGTGATTGNLIVSETVNLPVQNQTYFFSTAAVVPANVPAGAGPIRIAICDIATCFVQLASTSIVSGTNGVVSGTFNNGTHTSITILYQIPGVAVPNGDQIIFSEPFIKLGSTPAGYVVGDAFGATNANNGLSLSSLKIGVSAVQPTVTGTVSSTTGTTTTAHTFSAPFTSTPPCVGTPTTNAGAWYFSTPPSTTSTGVITYTGTAPQSFNISCTGAGGVW